MAMKPFTLIEKTALTSDVFELTFEWSEKIDMKPGQFITFILPGVGGRAYSIADTSKNTFTLLIKRWSEENGGRWGSIAICDSSTWDTLNWVGPSGHFVLTENNKNKLFIGTGTGLVPLYNQILWATDLNQTGNLTLLFGVRTLWDLFYTKELDTIKEKNWNFNYEVYLSREESESHNKWYTIDYLTSETVEKFDEYYICWAPAMIDWAVEKLKNLWVKEENIFMERY